MAYSQDKVNLLLVDGAAMMYRAHYALSNLRSKSGQATGATYGSVTMLRRLSEDYPQALRACIFDAPGPTFRNEMYAQYKAQRPPMPEELASQIATLHACVEAMGWTLLMEKGVEADDVIATLVRAAEKKQMLTLMASKDKDLAQLISSQTFLINDKYEIIGEEEVEKKYGVKPSQIVDFLTLMGDAADNVPGVAKVGEKTAAKLLQAYGSLDNLVLKVDEVPGMVGKNLKAALPVLPLSKKLVSLKFDVPLAISVEDLQPQPMDVAALTPLFETLGFDSLLKSLSAETGISKSSAPSEKTKPAAAKLVAEEKALAPHLDELLKAARQRSGDNVITETKDLVRWVADLMQAPLAAVDTETDSLEPMKARLVGISFAVAPGRAAYVPLAHQGLMGEKVEQIPLQEALEILEPWLSSHEHLKVGQNLKYDMHVFKNHGVTLSGIAHDTLLESYVLESHLPHALDKLAWRHLNLHSISFTDITRGRPFAEVEVEQASTYASEDVDLCLRVHDVLWPKLSTSPPLQKVYADIEMPVMPVLWRMERQGVLIDAKSLNQLSHELGERLRILEKQAEELAGTPFNLNSPKQIQEILFNRLSLPVYKKTPKGDSSTNEEVLERLAEDHPLPKALLEHRMLSKLKNTYTDTIPPQINQTTGRLHTQFSQAVAVTGRLASVDPNLQNIPIRTPQGRRIRAAFIAPPGHKLVSVDYSQIELRIMAHLSKDANLCAAFVHAEDVHRRTASEIFAVSPEQVDDMQRRSAKAINFGLIYGLTAFGLARQLNVDRASAESYMARYFARYPGVAHYMEETRRSSQEQGHVETVFGRRLYVASHAQRQAAERAAINAPMQGTAADLIKLAMIAVQGWLDKEKLAAKLILQVHDELVLEVPENELAKVKEKLPGLMTDVVQLSVPLQANLGVGDNWDEAH